jgi:tetratricopeptide (TPR) repeat protein
MDWPETLKRLAILTDAKELTEADRIYIRDIEEELSSKEAYARQYDDQLETIINIAEIRQRFRLGDPGKLLYRAYSAVEAGYGSLRIREQLARGFLSCDLPWTALALLGGQHRELSGNGAHVLSQARLALRLIREDAAYAIGNSYGGGAGITADRLVDLLGIPPYVVTYEQLTDEHISQREWYDPPLPPIETRTAPLVPLLLKKSCERVNLDLLPHVVPNASKELTANDTDRLKLLIERFEKKDAEESKFSQRDIAFLTHSAIEDDQHREHTFHLAQVLSISGVIVLLFQVRKGTFIQLTQAVIVVGLSGKSPLVYTLSGEVNTAAALRQLQVNPSAPPHIALISTVGSGSVLTITAFDPATRKVWKIASRLDKGVFNVLDMGPMNPPVLVISFSTGNRRYGDANQAPSRRGAVLICYDSETAVYVAIAMRRGGTDEYAATNQNLFGMNPEMWHIGSRGAAGRPPGFAEDLVRLADRSASYIAEGLKQDAARLSIEVRELYFQVRNFAEAARIYAEATSILSDDAATVVLECNGHLLLDLIEALVYGRNLRRAKDLLSDPRLLKASANFRDMELSRLSMAANIAISLGDFSSAFDALEAWRARAGTDSPYLEGTLTLFLAEVGDDSGSYTSGLAALDLAIAKTTEARNVAIDMLHLARASLRLGRIAEALDWLSRVLRLTRSFGDPELTGSALRSAANLALSQGLPEIAIVLLDQAITCIGETSWETDGASLLLLYGVALERMGEVLIADEVLAISASLGARDRGATMIAALAARANLADERGATDEAFSLSERAFRAVLEGCSRIGQETYKLTFVDTSKSVADQYLELIARVRKDPELMLDAMEDWRLQIFRELYADDVTLAAEVSGIARILQKLLHLREAFVSYAMSPSGGVAVLVTPAAINLVRIPATSVELTSLIAKVKAWLDLTNVEARAYIEAMRVPKELVNALVSLHRVLVAPLGLPRDTKFLAISPDESLAGVPWGALLLPTGRLTALLRQLGRAALHPLCRRFAMAIVPSARLLLNASRNGLQTISSRTPAVIV